MLGVAARYPRDLSGGERQRAAVAAVVAGTPAVALLDEPTRGLDQATRAALLALLRRLLRSGVSIVLATHDADLVHALGARIVRVEAGKAEWEPALEGSAP